MPTQKRDKREQSENRKEESRDALTHRRPHKGGAMTGTTFPGGELAPDINGHHKDAVRSLSLSLAALSSVYLERNSPRPCRLAPSIPRQRNLFPLLRCSRVSYSCPPHCAMAKGAQEDIPEALCFGGLEQREHLGQAHSLELFHKWKFKATFEAHCTQRKDWTVGPVKWLWYPILLDSRVPSH